MESDRDKFIVPIGPGGIFGRIFRFIVFFCTAGFVYPCVFVEGMDISKLHGEQQGTLYNKK